MSEASALVNLAPLLEMLAVGLLLAVGPVWWVWRRHAGASPQRRRHALAVLTLFLTFDLVLFGAFTRLSDAGLGCPDWPGCYGQSSPLAAHAEISAAQAVMPSGPVTHSKAWIEMVHRYLATGVGALILLQCLWAWASGERGRRLALAVLTLVWVCLQGAFGALTVTLKLFPAIVTLHLLGGLVLLALLRAQAAQLVPQAMGDAAVVPTPPSLHRALWWLMGLVFAQAALGAWVSTNYAVLACRDFPTCQGAWWPPMDLGAGFSVWRDLGLNADGSALPFAALTAIHMMHRLGALLVLTALVLVGARMRSETAWRARAWWLWGLAAWQLATGVSNVVLEWPLAAALAHTGGAAMLVLVIAGWLLPASGSVPQRHVHAAPLGRERMA